MSSGPRRPSPIWRHVHAVHDGDTIRVGHVLGSGHFIPGEEVRLIGIDAPEMHPKDDRPPEEGAEEARDFLERLLRGRLVRLIGDELDRYERRLAYVERTDGTDVGEEMLRGGHAKLYVFNGEPFARCPLSVGSRRGSTAGQSSHAAHQRWLST